MLVPFRVRREFVCLRRLPRWLAERSTIASHRADQGELSRYTWRLAAHSSPLNRSPGLIPSALQEGKETNIALAAARLDGLVVEPNQVFSHHHTIGRTTRHRGFRRGMELQNEESTASWGGGLCQVSNSFYWVAVQAGMRIVERHRHGLDLFPDNERTVPFGCGATVVYNYADFRFENPLPQPILVRARIEDGEFISELWTTTDPGYRFEVEEFDHRFFERDGALMRENRLRRRVLRSSGELLSDTEIAHNTGRVQYEMPSASGGISVIRGLAKGALLWAFGATGTTSRMYRTITRDWMGSQATHVDKLRRVWPGYVGLWREVGVELEGADIWVHEGGWTPFPFFVNHLLTGKAGIVTNREGRMLDRYLARAVNGSLTCELPDDLPLEDRRTDLEPLRWAEDVHTAVMQLGGTLHEGIDIAALPLPDSSADLCHSGGTLEHYPIEDLRLLLSEARRILRPGGTMSHVFDHRDHLHHADATWPFLRHYGMSEVAYRILCTNPLLFHNRLLPGEVVALFEEAGFERIAVHRMMLPSKRYVVDGSDMSDGSFGIDRSDLSPRFRQGTDDDLRTAAAHYLFRKQR